MKCIKLLSILILILFVFCTTRNTIEQGYIENYDTKLFYKTMGSGEPIVVLHGGPGFDHRQFLPYIWELSSKYKVILYDQRGTGLSTSPVDSNSITIDNFIADIEKIRTYFNIEKMNLLGHSWGGILAMHYSKYHHDKLKSLILCSTCASIDCFKPMQEAIKNNRLPEDTKLLETISSSDEFKNNDPKTLENFWRIYFKAYFVDQSLTAEMDLKFTENTIKYSNQVAGYIFKSIGAFDLYDDLKNIQCPTLIIHGDSDPMPVEYAQKIHDNIENSQLVIAEKSGHWLFVDATECFRNSIFAFLSKIDN